MSLNRRLNQIVFHYTKNNITVCTFRWSSVARGCLLPACLTSVCIMDLSEVINRPCSYSCFLLSLFVPLRWIMAHCATCRWVALLWLPYGHQALHIYCPWITENSQQHILILLLLPLFTLLSVLHFRSRLTSFLALTASPFSFPMPWSCSMHSQQLN